MERAEALQIVGALADGRNPLTGEPLAGDHVCQHPQVVRALCLLVQQWRAPEAHHLPDGATLPNAGKPWTSAEDAELVRGFDAGAKLSQLALKHGRTAQAIQGRLYRLGKVPRWQLAPQRGNEAKGAAARQMTPGPLVSSQVRLDGLNAAAVALVRADFSPDELPAILRVEIESLQRQSGRAITPADGADGIWFAWGTERPRGYLSPGPNRAGP